MIYINPATCLFHTTSKLLGLNSQNYACEEASSLAQVVAQWTGNPKAAGSIPVGRQFFALLFLSSRRSGGSSLGFRAGSL